MPSSTPRLTPSRWGRLREQALALGFDALGAAPAEPLAEARGRLRPGNPSDTGLPAWLAAGHQGSMGWMAARPAEREDPAAWWPGARTVIMGAVSYDGQGEPGEADGGAGEPRARVSRHAWGRDYHEVVRGMLKTLGRRLELEVPGSTWRTTLDRTLAMEKPLAVLAGLGWVGKHGNLIRLQGSSWCVLGGLLTDAEIDESEPFSTEHCGTCTACIEACPTGAIVAPAVVDARRCVSYLTIETRTAVPEELRAGLGSWVFGCDVCQDVCPWNSKRSRQSDARFEPSSVGRAPRLVDLLGLDEQGFRDATSRSGIRRAQRSGLVSSAAIAAGNSGDADLVPALLPLLAEPQVRLRSQAAWALGRLGGQRSRAALDRLRKSDPDQAVRTEASRALADAAPSARGMLPPVTSPGSDGREP